MYVPFSLSPSVYSLETTVTFSIVSFLQSFTVYVCTAAAHIYVVYALTFECEHVVHELKTCIYIAKFVIFVFFFSEYELQLY